MGISGGIDDLSSESIPILIMATAAHSLSYFRHLLCNLLRILSLGLGFHERGGGEGEEVSGFEGVGSGLAALIVLAEQLQSSKSRAFLYYRGDAKDGEERERDCAVCLLNLREGEEVRRLWCGHLFHRKCSDAWFYRQRGDCPVCRCPVVGLGSDERQRVTAKERQVSGELFSWFSSSPASLRRYRW
ncbi:hypothetical protein AMTRI_Chr12g268890 [Amborella trichopoda]|uniref:RING-type domain-containing protein n=1 Tax=Amborella trichopoda TaxID=13333 RepID=U5D494_AMBTC|nr:E3 ubiquitin-protein ligase RHA2A [Amborella trichopoda]ERN17269.1 hypothetical protein AMTR_s00044p00221710 [Amborella trichopoda]|eukprot:XP_006855802.1 E3 ubiquitin-protein ligase RHA2A [Amborella trichopoda]